MKLPELDGIRVDDGSQIEEEYRRIAADAQHEREAEEWCEGLIGDVADLE